MRRQRRPHHYVDRDSYDMLNGGREDFLQMDNISNARPKASTYRFENTLEASVGVGDTLQALALKFHCTVADIKRLNKIDKDNEIHAHKVIKIPITVQSVLLGAATLPTVHKSGTNSPKQLTDKTQEEPETNIMRSPLEDADVMLSEKLLVASVNSAGTAAKALNRSTNTNFADITDKDSHTVVAPDTNDTADTSPLLCDILLDNDVGPHIRPIRGPPLKAFDWSGSDCDMSWICLFILILALCFVIPLIYVIYLAEHPHQHNVTSH